MLILSQSLSFLGYFFQRLCLLVHFFQCLSFFGYC